MHCHSKFLGSGVSYLDADRKTRYKRSPIENIAGQRPRTSTAQQQQKLIIHAKASRDRSDVPDSERGSKALTLPKIRRSEVTKLGVPDPYVDSVLSLLREKVGKQSLKFAKVCLELTEEAKDRAEASAEANAEARWQARTRLERIAVLEEKVKLRDKLSLIEGELRRAYSMGRGIPRVEVWARAFEEHRGLRDCIEQKNRETNTPQKAAQSLHRVIEKMNTYLHPFEAAAQARGDVTRIVESDILPRADCLLLECVFDAFNVEKEFSGVADPFDPRLENK